MKVICAGLFKTGTKSISEALRQLGFIVFDWEEQTFDFLDHWVDVFQNGSQPDVKRVYQNADAVVDMPGCFFWEEILEAFPDCKVILSEREEDSWLQSWVNQLEMIESFRSSTRSLMSPSSRKMRFIFDSIFEAVLGSTNKGSTCVFRKRYRTHNHRVKSIVSPDKLLLYNVKEGWEPLCDFLGCKAPTTAFPHQNVKGEITKTILSTSRYIQQVKWEIQRALLIIVSVTVVIAAALFCISY